MITENIASNFDSVSEGIWSSMVNIALVSTEFRKDTSRVGGTVTSSVQIVGRWNGAVCLDMSADLALHATASLIGAEPSELSHDDVRDAAGELANMTAGGMKELLPEPCQISLPTVVMGTDFEVSIPQGVVVYRSAFSTLFGSFLVTLIQAEDQGTGETKSEQSSHHEKYSALGH
jgi:chemotaxis protein CheX